MRKFVRVVERLSLEMDKAAGFCIAAVMVLVVCNVILRKVFKQPILGTYELVGYLTALGVSLALASCAFQNGHIALDYLVNKFPEKIRALLNMGINLTVLCFWGFSSWHVGKYAQNLMENGVVSPTAQIPVYPFVLLIGLGLVGLCLVSLVRVWEYSGILLADLTLFKLPRQPGIIEDVRKAVR